MRSILEQIRGGLVISCQASGGDAFCGPGLMARFARAAQEGGAAGIRANGPEDVASIAAATGLPVIGIQKVVMEDGRVLITPTLEDAAALVKAGASAVALDCTARGQRYGALERLRQIRAELGVAALADIATEEEALAAAEAGADAVLSTMRGYTGETNVVTCFEPEFIARLREAVRVPVIAEGMIGTPEEARAALEAGAWAVIVGTAVTRPHEITRRFVRGLRQAAAESGLVFAGIDLGASYTKYGLADGLGKLRWSETVATPAQAGRQRLIELLVGVATRCLTWARETGIPVVALGAAVAGWVDRATGTVSWATGNIPDWQGAEVGRAIEEATGLPVAVLNDAAAAALAERNFGEGRMARNFIVLTLGTGVGGGVWVNGRPLEGSAAMGGALGHVVVERDGLACTCGQQGCLEQYANAAALARYGAGEEALGELAAWLARGCASMIHVLDPELIVLTGGLVRGDGTLAGRLAAELERRVVGWTRRKVAVKESALGYEAGVLGAAAAARDKWRATHA